MNEKPSRPDDSSAAATRLQAVVSIANSGDFVTAEKMATELGDSDVASRAWQWLSEQNANTQRWVSALSYLEKALAIEPGNRKLRLARAWLLEQCGNDPAALAELESLADEAADSPRLLAHLATHFASAGRIDEAQSTLVRALERWPTEAALHTRLARLSWQRGAGLEAFAPLLRAIEQHPRELQLRLVAADQLRSAGEMPRALELLERGLQLAPDSATFRTSIGALLESMDRLDEALPMLRDACRRAPRSVPARRNLIPALLRLGEAAEARALCEALLAEFPDDQMLIAQRATALRLAGDPEYRRLFDYPRLVRQFALEPAAPYAHIAQFNQDFARELTALHRSTHHPLEQSLRGGSQTERQLPRDNPVIAAFFAMLAAPIRRYIDALGVDATHPVDRRRSADFRISGSWSVQLQTGGFHIDHVHPRGWLSSAYYVSLPAMADTEARAGWLKFGEPGPRLPACAAEHFVRPEAGTLVLFPSYMWHGTVPFTDTGPRLTAAFDVVPA